VFFIKLEISSEEVITLMARNARVSGNSSATVQRVFMLKKLQEKPYGFDCWRGTVCLFCWSDGVSTGDWPILGTMAESYLKTQADQLSDASKAQVLCVLTHSASSRRTRRTISRSIAQNGQSP
jgi:hypothetical protein